MNPFVKGAWMTRTVATAEPKSKKTNNSPPVLRFTPYAWAKLLFLRDAGPTEVGGFGISPTDDLLLIENVRLIGQRTSVVTVAFDDESVADFFDQQVDAGLAPAQFFRLWLHTHPGDSAAPSCVDEETFERVFGRCDWAVMAILASGGETYARLRFAAGPGGEIEIPVRVDYSASFAGADHTAWEREYEQSVQPIGDWRESALAGDPLGSRSDPWDGDAWDLFDDEEHTNDARSLFPADGSRAADEIDGFDGNSDRRGSDRPPGRHPVGGTRCAASATD